MEIKFRGLMTTGEWVYGLPHLDLKGSTAYFNECSYRICWNTETGGTSNAPIKNGTLTQYLGLSDVDEKEIYIGDILEFDNGDRIEIKTENWLEPFAQAIGKTECEDQWRDLYRIERAKIIGNIYEGIKKQTIMETKTIKGTINFEITLSPTEGIKVDYNSSIENEIGALCISELMLSDSANYYTHLKNTTTGKDKVSKEKLKIFTATANVLKKGRTGVAKALNIVLNNYESYAEEQKLIADKKEEVATFLKEKGVTVESGVMDEAQVKEILAERKKEAENETKGN